MQLSTLNRKAFNQVTLAIGEIEKYYKTYSMDHLESAEKQLNVALSLDQDYLGATFYLGMTKDLIGRPADAETLFMQILDNIEDEKIISETKYNLAVSYYHQYSHPLLQKASNIFIDLVNNTSDLYLKALVYANLAQTYAMWMQLNKQQLENFTTKPGRAVALRHVREKFKYSNVYVQRADEALMTMFTGDPTKLQLKKKISATMNNAKGMSHMYYTDHLCGQDIDCKAKYLEKSLSYLGLAEKTLPKDWANTCDLGSAHMRLGLILTDLKARNIEWQRAKEKLQKVVKTLRPGYGFALYELGRLHRIWGAFDEAIEYFDKALQVPVKYRDVGDYKVNTEKVLAINRDPNYRPV